MIKIDYHIHTNRTRDGKGNVEDYCKRAEEIGVKEIAITNHLIFPWIKVNGSVKPEKIGEIFEEIEKTRNNSNIKIKFGLEIDYFENYERDIEKVLNEYPFDFVLGSTHFLDGLNITDPIEAKKFFVNKDVLNEYRKYFGNLKKAIESQFFDVMAHPDCIRRWANKYYPEEPDFEKYQKLVAEVIEALVNNNIGIEVNGSGYNHPVQDSYPRLEFLKLCKQNGVEIVTIGSDAHEPSYLSFELTKVIEKLKKTGYEKICLFDKRKPKVTSIKEIL